MLVKLLVLNIWIKSPLLNNNIECPWKLNYYLYLQYISCTAFRCLCSVLFLPFSILFETFYVNRSYIWVVETTSLQSKGKAGSKRTLPGSFKAGYLMHWGMPLLFIYFWKYFMSFSMKMLLELYLSISSVEGCIRKGIWCKIFHIVLLNGFALSMWL